MNQANLQNNINPNNIIVNQLVTDLSNAMTLSLKASTEIDVSNVNLLVLTHLEYYISHVVIYSLLKIVMYLTHYKII